MKEIYLSKNKIALVDDDVYTFINQWKWYAHYNKRGNKWYAIRRSPRPEHKEIYMFKILFKPPIGTNVHFIDNNALNLQRSNILIMSNSADRHNKIHTQHNKHSKSSKYKGVSWHKAKHNWRSQIKKRYLGSFKTDIEAAWAYDKAAKEEYGQFAKLNFE